jgi:uncharacterized alkaline shock family protein YloU
LLERAYEEAIFVMAVQANRSQDNREAPAPGEVSQDKAPEVLALVGASGTGKSYQASFVAHDYAVDVIIDDGLLVRDGKILAGKSAKGESTRVGAIRRAIFSLDNDAADVRAALAGCAPQRILVLGTSLGMIARIVVALDLPSPSRIIHIEDVSRPGDIRRARRIRRQQGKHVIPAPTLEVRKTFSGYLIDPLRFFLRPKGGPAHVLVEKSVVRPTWSTLGRFYINDIVLSSIALRAAREIEGVARPLRAKVDSSPEGTTLHLELALKLGCEVVQVCREAQVHVRRVVEHMTGLNIPAVNVIARTMLLPE